MKQLALAVLVASAGCGRVGFVPFGDGDDASVGDDAGMDPDGASSFCASLTRDPLLCDDFSDGVMVPWLLISEDLGTVVEANGLLTTTTSPLASSTDVTRAFWKRQIGTQNLGAEVAFDIDTPTSSINDPVILELVFGVGGGDEHYFDWVHKLDGPAYIEEIVVRPPAADQYFYYATPTAISPGPHHISMTFDATQQTIVGVVDGMTLISAATNDTMTGDCALHIGVPFLAGPSAPWEFRFDNLLVNTP